PCGMSEPPSVGPSLCVPQVRLLALLAGAVARGVVARRLVEPPGVRDRGAQRAVLGAAGPAGAVLRADVVGLALLGGRARGARRGALALGGRLAPALGGAALAGVALHPHRLGGAAGAGHQNGQSEVSFTRRPLRAA